MELEILIEEDEPTPPTFTINDEINRQYRRFSTTGTQLAVRFVPPTDDTDPMSHFLASVNELFEYALRDCSDSDWVGITIRNDENEQDKPIGISFRRKDQLSGEVIWNVLGRVAQSNARFNVTDKLIVTVHSVKMPGGFGGVKTNGRQLSVMAHLKKSIIEDKAEQNCLAHALIIAIAKVNDDPDYQSYRKGYKIRPVVDRLLETTGIDLSKGAGLSELTKFQDHFCDYKIVVYDGLNRGRIMFEGQVQSSQRLNLLYDDVTRHCHVIRSLTGALAKEYVCRAFNKGCRNDMTHVCDQTCRDCMANPPCVSSGVRIPCDQCNRHFRSPTCFENHKKRQGARKKSVCDRKKCCKLCGLLIITRKQCEHHECNKRYCANCKQYKEARTSMLHATSGEHVARRRWSYVCLL
jgi:hypothetical protein